MSRYVRNCQISTFSFSPSISALILRPLLIFADLSTSLEEGAKLLLLSFSPTPSLSWKYENPDPNFHPGGNDG